MESCLGDMGTNLPNLNNFVLGANHFTGRIPITFSNASKLEKFDVGFNNIVGPVLFSLKDLKSLKWLSLGENQLGMGSANGLEPFNFSE